MPSGSIVTNAGIAQITNAMLKGEKANWTKIAVGDGGGSEYLVDATQTQLVNQLWSGAIDEMLQLDDKQVQFHTAIPSDVGPFTIREIGILNDDDVLVAVAIVPAQNKINISETSGVSNDMDITMQVFVDNASVIEVNVDPNLIIATRDYVDKRLGELVTDKELEEQLQSYVTDEKLGTKLEDYITSESFNEFKGDVDLTELQQKVETLETTEQQILETLNQWV